MTIFPLRRLRSRFGTGRPSVPEGASRRGRLFLRAIGRVVLAGLSGLLLLVLLLGVSRSGFVDPSPTLLLRDRNGEHLGEIGASPDGEAGYWPVERIPERVALASIAVEDRRFLRHAGVDPLAVARAFRQNLLGGRRISGASTLAMQVARMQRPGARCWTRKVVEAATAIAMTARHGREGVLRQYLRLVPYGNRIHGIVWASRRYLDKPVEDLSWAETAFLAALPQAPGRMNPFDPVGRWSAIRRGRRILLRLRSEGRLPLSEFALAWRELPLIRIPLPPSRPEEALHPLLLLEERLRPPRAQQLRGGGPVVSATLDLSLQRIAALEANRALAEWGGSGARNAAAIVADRKSLEVLAWQGSAGYFDASRAGAIDYARVPRSPGSCLKPFLYALALDRGIIGPASILDDLERGPGGIANADGAFLGPLLPRVALATSRNVPAAELVRRLGVGESWDLFRRLALHDGARPARDFGLGLAIGALPVRLEELVAAYGALANDGLLRPLSLLADAPPADPKRIFSPEAARQVTLFLSDPSARLPVFPRMGSTEYPFPVAVKTGTSSRFRDSWAVAWSSTLLVGVWIGDPDNRPMNHLTGARAAAELAHRILLAASPARGEDFGFPVPEGFRPSRLCPLTGRLASSACEGTFVEWFRPGSEPVDGCSAHLRVAFDRETGRPATAVTPRGRIEERLFVDLPPRYAAWMASAGLKAPPGPRWQLDSGETSADHRAFGRELSPRIAITSPLPGSRLLRDPETPAPFSSLALRAHVDPPVPQLVWWVDGAPFATVDSPYSARWPLEPGSHSIEARLPWGGVGSGAVRIVVE